MGDLRLALGAHVADRESLVRSSTTSDDCSRGASSPSHLPAADGTSLEEFLTVLERVPDAERFVPPDSEQFAQMIEAMNEMQRQGGADRRLARPPTRPARPSPPGWALGADPASWRTR